MTSNSKVHILLSTFNGANYLTDQLNSLLKQTYKCWELIIRDDGSSDGTHDIIRRFINLDKRISLIEDSYGNLKSSLSFSILMEKVKTIADYVMFCDQDDIWFPNKIEISLKKMQELELKSGKNISLLVYGTYQLIDQHGRPLSNLPPVFPSHPTINLLLAENYIYGCTTIINKYLLNKSVPISKYAENSDYWMAITALATNGKISYISNPLLFYRQHQNNVTGSYQNAFFLNRLNRISHNSYNIIIKRRMKMFVDLVEKFENDFSTTNRDLLSGYIKNVSEGGFKAIAYCIRMNIHKLYFLQTASYYFGIFNGIRNSI